MTFYRNLGTAFEEFVDRKLEWVMIWPLFAYAVVLWLEPDMFDRYSHYDYLIDSLKPFTWEIAFLVLATLRLASLISKMFWRWPYYAPLALCASVGSATLWSQFTLSFAVSYYLNGTTPGPLAAHSTLIIIECLNVSHASKGVGELLKRGRG